MRTFALTDDEVSLITALRTLPPGQRQLLLEMTLEMAAPEISYYDAHSSGAVIQFPYD